MVDHRSGLSAHGVGLIAQEARPISAEVGPVEYHDGGSNRFRAEINGDGRIQFVFGMEKKVVRWQITDIFGDAGWRLQS